MLYAFKILLFKKQFKLKRKEERALQLLCIYAIRFHIRAWFRAGNAIEAPYHDFCFLKNVYEFRKIDPDVSSIVIKKFCNHLWYLNGKTIALAFFDSNVHLNEKREMVRVLLEYMANPEEEDSPELRRNSIGAYWNRSILRITSKRFHYSTYQGLFHAAEHSERFSINRSFNIGV